MDTKTIRLNLLLTQQEFADKLGVSIVTVQKWERGVNQPSLKHQREIKNLTELVEKGMIKV